MRNLVGAARLRHLDAVVARRLLRPPLCDSLRSGFVIRRVRYRPSRPGNDHAAAEREPEPLDQSHRTATQLRRRLGHDERTEEVVAELQWLRDREVVLSFLTARPAEIDRLRRPALSNFNVLPSTPGCSVESTWSSVTPSSDGHPEDLVSAERTHETLVMERSSRPACREYSCNDALPTPSAARRSRAHGYSSGRSGSK